MKRIRTYLAALTVACSLASCGEITGPDGPPSPVGTWDLVRVDGQTPPIRRVTHFDGFPLPTINGRILEFRSNGSLESIVDTTDPVTGVRTTTTVVGTWTRGEVALNSEVLMHLAAGGGCDDAGYLRGPDVLEIANDCVVGVLDVSIAVYPRR